MGARTVCPSLVSRRRQQVAVIMRSSDSACFPSKPERRRAPLSFRLSFHPALLGRTGACWLDDPPDVTCKDSTRQDAVDDWRLSCNSRFRVRVPAPAPGTASSCLISS